MTAANSTGLKAARAHQRMKGIMRHSQEKPWMGWVVGLVVLAPFILLVVLGLIGFQ